MSDPLLNPEVKKLSRRTLLRGMMALGAVSMSANLLAACVAPVAPAPAAAPAAQAPAPSDTGPDPKKLEAFKPSDTAGEKPKLPKRIAWANTSNAELFLAITNSIQASAEGRGLEFITAIANDDSAKNIEQINTFMQRGIAALCIQPL